MRIAIEIDGYQRGGGDLVPAKAIRVHQETIGLVRKPGRYVVEDLEIPAVVMGDAKCGGELNAQIALGIAHFIGTLRLELRAEAITFMVLSQAR